MARREDAQLPPLLALLRLVAASPRTFPDSIVASVICNRLSQYADDASNPCPPPLHLHVQRGLGEEMARGTPDVARYELGCRFPIFRDGSAAFGLATASVAPGPCHRVCMECVCPCLPSGCERQLLVGSWVDWTRMRFGRLCSGSMVVIAIPTSDILSFPFHILACSQG